MGAFFTNVQVLAREGREQEVRDAIVAALGERARSEGLVACKGEEAAERTIVVGPPGRWIGVYDEATESQAVERLEGLAKTLSGAADGFALGVLVHDSDHLLLALYERGKKVDSAGLGKKKGNAARWAGVVGEAGVAGLRKALGADDLFAEDSLRQVATVLGIPEERACTGYTYLVEAGAEPLADGTWSLRYRRSAVPAHELPATGPAKLVLRVPPNGGEGLSIGGQARVHVWLNNEGGPSRGLTVAVHGPAVEAGLFEADKVAVSIGTYDRKNPRPLDAAEMPVERRALLNGRPGMVAVFPDLQIPASTGRLPERPEGMDVSGWFAFLQKSGIDPSRTDERLRASDVQAYVHGRGVAAGQALLYVSFVPHEAKEAQVHFAAPVGVVAATRAPLRGAQANPSAYVPLETPHVLTVLAISTLDGRSFAPIATDIVERWSVLWRKEAVLDCTISLPIRLPQRPSKPRAVKLAADGLPASKPWKKLREAFAGAAVVAGRGERVRVTSRPFQREGFEFRTGVPLVRNALASDDADVDPALPTLSLCVGLKDRSDAGDLLDRARRLIDELVARGACAQAFVARWGHDAHATSTAYEEACGIGGELAVRRSWASRFLRAASADGMWLGPELIARVDRAAVEAVSRVEPVGQAVRVVLREGATLDALESALAPVLASAADLEQAREADQVARAPERERQRRELEALLKSGEPKGGPG